MKHENCAFQKVEILPRNIGYVKFNAFMDPAVCAPTVVAQWDSWPFVLTSKRTFSGAEEFTYDLQNEKRATIVGETTGGGAHPVAGHTVADYFHGRSAVCESRNPISKTNWEGTGVEPDVNVPAAGALTTAENLAIEKITQGQKQK